MLGLATSLSVRQRHCFQLHQLRRISTKRFWKTVDVSPAAGAEAGQGYQVSLDGKPLRTPAKNALVVPSKSLALAIAAEWEWLDSARPKPHLMPMMSLAATALDQPQERGKVVDSVFKFIHTDAACCRYEPGELADRQAATFDPLLEKLRGDLGWRLRTSESIAGAQQSDETAAAVLSYLRSLDHWHLAATEELTSACKSLVLATALVREHIGIQQGITAARLEELFQIEDWGAVEAGHDLDEADISTRIAGPVLFLRLLKDGS